MLDHSNKMQNLSAQDYHPEGGMTMLEIMFAIMLLMIMTIGTSTLLRNGLDMRVALSEQARFTHRSNLAMEKITQDIEHAYIISYKDLLARKAEDKVKTLFRIKSWEGSSELRLTTMDHRPTLAAAPESDQVFVVYRIEKDTRSQRSHLYRGELTVMPDSFDQDVPMNVLVSNVKALKIYPWNGNDWKDEWDSSRRDWQDLLPKMLRVEIEIYLNEPTDPEEPIPENSPTEIFRTVVTIPRAMAMKEAKDPTSKIDYY